MMGDTADGSEILLYNQLRLVVNIPVFAGLSTHGRVSRISDPSII